MFASVVIGLGCFNSFMVRLEVEELKTWYEDVFLFQFLYGAIGRLQLD